ncbi:MAG: hypothetical protein IT348_09385 [Candidatus Eisenbacteria bacterium]|nr:hypothetical protein [Candidatus Eisenbacteria bacterium]
MVSRPPKWIRPFARLVLGWIVLASLSGCGKGSYMGLALPNTRPTAEITQWPTSTTDPSQYAYEFSWAGTDPDGRVVAFRYAVDPPREPNRDTLWVHTTENRRVFTFAVDSVAVPGQTVARRYHTLVIEAIDNAGAYSPPVDVSFTASTVAPVVSITSPVPSALGSKLVAPTVEIRWNGRDPDGAGARLPVVYRWRMFSESSTPSATVIAAHPDTVRTLFAPEFAGWDSLPGTATSVRIANLTPRQRYLFVIVAFDAAGAMSNTFALNQNILDLYVDVVAAIGPRLTLFNDYFFYQYPSGGWFSDPTSFIAQEFPAGIPIPLSWAAAPAAGGARIEGYRWAVDLASLDDETPRTNESTDLSHWSQFTTGTSVTLPAFEDAGTTPHYFYLQATDDIGYTSLAVVQFTVRRPTFERDLLIINDTGFPVDRLLAAGCVDRPRLAWPNAAELDSFLYAVGGKPWKCYPAGTLSTPGLFAGYSFDTLSTRVIPQSALTLGLLDSYRNVIWMTDLTRARANGAVGSLTNPTALLRGLVVPGVGNPLATWVAQGGRLWLMGGGAAYASLRDFKPIGTPDNVFRSSTGELVAGRFLYNWAYWRSEITLNLAVQVARSPRAIGGWSGAPDYSLLPPFLQPKSSATDPLPPQRVGGDFYSSTFTAEYLSQPNSILEGGAFEGDSAYAVLDTLFTTQGAAAGAGWPVMTYYHGSKSAPFVFSGFPLWYFRRAHSIALVDFVLQEVWKMPRRPVER